MTTPTGTWRGQVQMGIGWGQFVGRAGDGAAHAHHAVQLLLSESAQAVWTRPTGWLRVSGIVIGADVEHQLAPTTESVSWCRLGCQDFDGSTTPAGPGMRRSAVSR